MAGKQAKVLHEHALEALLNFVSVRRHASRNRVIVLLSIKAGLRAGEIAQLTWPMVLRGDGQISTSIELRNAIAKKASARRLPLHPELRAALTDLQNGFVEGPIV